MGNRFLQEEEWQNLEKAYHGRIQPWLEAFRERRIRGEKHPVHDFLFEYYQCKRSILINWHPPMGYILQGKAARKYLNLTFYQESGLGIFLNPEDLDEKTRHRADWIARLLEAALNREPQTHCFGLHEWAMVYKSACIRHRSTPLRLTPAEIERVIESQTIRCSHYDAFRFFTEAAQPRNTLQPEKEDRSSFEQFGCVHFNMDLLKWCYKLHPWVSSELLADCFHLALEARELDMRASPYDLSEYGFEAIRIETPDGRKTYQRIQMEIGEKGRWLAARLAEEITYLLNAERSCMT